MSYPVFESFPISTITKVDKNFDNKQLIINFFSGAGKDATALFNKYHQWVNYESMLSACVVGKLVKDPIFPPPTGNLPNSNFQGNIFVNKYTKYIFTSEFVYI